LALLESLNAAVLPVWAGLRRFIVALAIRESPRLEARVGIMGFYSPCANYPFDGWFLIFEKKCDSLPIYKPAH